MSDLENMENDVFDQEEILDEDASNAASIAGNPTISRSELMAMMVNYANSLGNKEELAAFVAKLPKPEEMNQTSDQIYGNNTQYAKGDAGKNKAGINSANAPAEPMKALPSMKEDLAVLFGEDSDLSEDFRMKTEALFEAAVATRVGIELSKIEEEFESKLEEEVSTLREEMEENIDAYLNYAVAQWMEDNKLAIENNLRAEMSESFLLGLKDLFDEHYVDIPEQDVPVVESMAAKIEELEAALNEQTEKNIELSQALAEEEVSKAVAEMTEGFTETQKDKFVKLVEATSYSSVEEFRKKASVIKETYFSNKGESKIARNDLLLSESVDEPESNVVRITDPNMQSYVSSLSRSIKR